MNPQMNTKDSSANDKSNADKLTPAEREKQKNLASALSDIEKSYGKGAIMRLGDKGALNEVRGLLTGALSLDLALGGKGLPKGRIVEIFGPESSGKTTLTLQVIASCQKEGGVCAFVDAEHALDPAYARKLGVKLDDLLVSHGRAGVGDRRGARALQRGRRGGHRLGGGPRSARGNRRRDGG
jgi:recombination protein RecA